MLDLDQIDRAAKPLLQERGLIVVSNRGPVEFHVREGSLQSTRGSGGLVSAISSLSKLVPFTWVASALSEGDRYVADKYGTLPVDDSDGTKGLSVKYVLNSPEEYDRYYNVYSNPFLWFLQHYMWDLAYINIDRTTHDAWDKGYVPVNERFASSIIKEAESYGTSPVIMVQDYQLYLADGLIREALPNAIIQHFIHIPWPAPRYWTMLPERMRSPILRSLCSCDIVGFQTRRDAENFVSTCEDLLPGVEVNLNEMTVWYQGRTTLARHYPISIDVNAMRDMAQSPVVREHEDRLRDLTSEKTIVRVDRLDPTKNILRGFRAYELMLSSHLDMLGKVTLMAFLVPSRTGIVRYQRYKEAVFGAVERINESFAVGNWQPIHMFYEENQPQAIAGMRLADLLLVNPIIDGMNLVAKEGPIVNSNNCTLVLSETAGAYEQLKPHAIPVTPTDIEGTADALYNALTMSEAERARRLEGMRSIIEREDIAYWLQRQLQDLGSLVSRS